MGSLNGPGENTTGRPSWLWRVSERLTGGAQPSAALIKTNRYLTWVVGFKGDPTVERRRRPRRSPAGPNPNRRPEGVAREAYRGPARLERRANEAVVDGELGEGRGRGGGARGRLPDGPRLRRRAAVKLG